MKVELSRYRVKPGKSARVDEWMRMLNARMAEVLETLDREDMKLEVIFRELIDGEEYFTWFSVQGEAGRAVETSPFDIDRGHLEFHEECINADYGRRDAQPQIVIVPGAVARALDWADPPAAAGKFQPREQIYRRGR